MMSTYICFHANANVVSYLSCQVIINYVEYTIEFVVGVFLCSRENNGKRSVWQVVDMVYLLSYHLSPLEK